MKNHINKIFNWIKEYAITNNKTSLIVGISGGIDSSVVSTLCAMTELKTIVVSIPLHQNKNLHNLSLLHAEWLKDKFTNVTHLNYDLSKTYDEFYSMFKDDNKLAQANTKSRLRMVTLYHIAQLNNGLVVGTGNKVEDFGVGFFTKYGDGGVDISPIGDCLKTEVWDIGRQLGIHDDIINAEPTDGLWEDGRTDKDQMHGLTYPELEQAMDVHEKGLKSDDPKYKIFLSLRNSSLHKMTPVPVCKITS